MQQNKNVPYPSGICFCNVYMMPCKAVNNYDRNICFIMQHSCITQNSIYWLNNADWKVHLDTLKMHVKFLMETTKYNHSNHCAEFQIISGGIFCSFCYSFLTQKEDFKILWNLYNFFNLKHERPCNDIINYNVVMKIHENGKFCTEISYSILSFTSSCVSKVLFSILHHIKYRITQTQDVINHNKQIHNHN